MSDPTPDALPCGHPKLSAGGCPLCRHAAVVASAAPVAPAPRAYTLEERFTCVHRGQATGKQVACRACDPTKTAPSFACAVHGECLLTLRVRDKDSKIATCAECKDRRPLPGMPDGYKDAKGARGAARPARNPAPRPKIEWVSTAQLVRDAALLAGKLPADCAGVVGLPRSGLIPASVIACHLHLPLYALDAASGLPLRLSGGSRGSRGGGGPLVVVDDTVFAGAALGRARTRLDAARVKYLTAAVYVRPDKAGSVDYYHKLTPAPHVLQWNLLNSAAVTGTLACDFDGVLCQDPAGIADDSEAYAAFLADAPPLLPPRKAAVPLVVTGRIERWRPQTEAWLAKWGVQVRKLVMHPAESSAARDAAGDVASIKARAYAASRCTLFLESDRRQAAEIFRLSGKPAVCVSTGEVLQ